MSPSGSRSSRPEHPNPLGNHHKLGQRGDLHLFHHAMTVGFHRPFRRAQLAGDLLVHHPPYNPLEDLSFSWAKVAYQGPQRSELLMAGLHSTDACQSTLNSSHQSILIDRLCEDVVRARLNDTYGGQDIRMPGQEDDGHRRSNSVEPILQFRPAKSGHLDIEQNAARAHVIRGSLQQLFCRGMKPYGVAAGAQEPARRGAEGFIVINDVDGA